MVELRSIKESIWQILPDRAAVTLQYWAAQRRLLNLNNPKRFSEKIQHRKLYDRDMRMPAFADKAKAKHLIAALVGPEPIIETLWVGRDIDSVDLGALQPPYVIKPTHACGEVIFVRDVKAMDWSAVRKQCRAWLKTTYGLKTREWLYQHIEPQIIIERMIGDGHVPPADIKLFVFHGVVKLIQIDLQRFSDKRQRAVFDRNWNRLNVEFLYPQTRHAVDRPKQFDRMIEVAEAVGAEFDFVRVDLYEADDRIYFGEATFYPASGYAQFHPSQVDEELGAHWNMTLKNRTAPWLLRSRWRRAAYASGAALPSRQQPMNDPADP